LNRDKERKQKELDELEAAARALVDVVNPNISGRTLLERLRDTPRSITNYAAGTAIVTLAYVLALVKSYIPFMDMKLLVNGAAAGCMEDQFNEYHQEMEPVAHMEDFSEDLF
jgi:CheY-like chemotaxis protein